MIRLRLRSHSEIWRSAVRPNRKKMELSILVSGSKALKRGRVEVSNVGLMVLSMKGIGKIIKPMVRGG